MRNIVFALLATFVAVPNALAKPDLYVQSLTLEPAKPAAGDGDIIIIFGNLGSDVDLSFTEYTNYIVKLDGKECESGTIFDLDGGDTNQESTNDCNPDTPGAHVISVTIDSDQDVDESDETNNTLTKTFTWDGPDLIVKSIQIDPATPNVTEGDISIVFTNIGKFEGDTSLFNATNYIVELDGKQCDSGFLLNDLGPGEENEESASSDCNASTPGPHEISVTIDSENEIAETDETNNTLTKTFSWNGSDLIVKSIQIDPEEPKVGDGDIQVVFTNIGKAEGDTSLFDSTNYSVKLDGKECDTGFLLNDLGPGEENEENISSDCNAETPGPHEISVTIDSENEIGEEDETNNTKTVIFTWTAPDLVVTDIVASADPLEPGKDNKFSATIKNIGPVDTDFFVSINITMYLDGSECATGLVILGLDSGQEATEDTSECNASTAGPHTIKYVVDTKHDVVELDENNNSFEKVFVWCGDQEMCTGYDDNCNGEIDEGFNVGGSCDGDDPDACANGGYACSADGTSVVCIEDGASLVEICDGIDNDCDGQIDEDFTQLGQFCDPDGECAFGTWVCGDDGGVTCEEGGGTEVCNGQDDDCDGEVDEDFVQLGGPCLVGVGTCQAVGVWACANDEVKCDAVAGAPALSEVCGDGLDNDCDGLSEENCPCDADTYLVCGSEVGTCTIGVQKCIAGAFSATCEDSLKPGSESCGNEKDDDCDGVVDEGCECKEGDARNCTSAPGSCSASQQPCIQGKWGPCIGAAPKEQACDGIDDDCDGLVNEGCPCAGGPELCDTAPDQCANYGRSCDDGIWSPCAAVPGTEDPGCDGGDQGAGAGAGPGAGSGSADTGGDTDQATDSGSGTGGDASTGGAASGGDTAGDSGADDPVDGGLAGSDGADDGIAAPGVTPPPEDSGCTSTPTGGSSAPAAALFLTLFVLGILHRRAAA